MVRLPSRLTFPSALRPSRLTANLGLWLGVSVAICFLTGLLSHLIQHPPGWFGWPSHPVQLYRGTHWTAWLAVGALALHVAVKLPLLRSGPSVVDDPADDLMLRRSRRRFPRPRRCDGRAGHARHGRADRAAVA